MDNQYRTDLACEFIKSKEALPDGAEMSRTECENGVTLERIDLSENAARVIGRSAGSYVTFNCGKLWELDGYTLDGISELISSELVGFAKKATGKKLSGDFSVLVVGLGNEKMTPDAVGPGTVSRITATRHLAEANPEMFKKLGCCRLSSVSPGVLGQTGIESSELVKGAVAGSSPDIVIAIDALAARSCERLASTIQLSDCGISPGSGVGNRRFALSRETLGVPVIALGVPTVVDSSTLVRDVLSMSGNDTRSDELENILSSGKSFFVAPKECDEVVRCVCRLLACGIDKAFGISLGNYA